MKAAAFGGGGKDENYLVEYCLYCASHGLPLMKDVPLFIIYKGDTQVGPIIKTGSPVVSTGTHWQGTWTLRCLKSGLSDIS